jgi:hypothetical protein
MTPYPEDWLCMKCKAPFNKHVKIGAPNEDDDGTHPAKSNWCYSYIKNNYLKNTADYFTPMDNLTLIETLAKNLK